MSSPHSPDSHLAGYVEDLRRIRDTLEKMAGNGKFGEPAKLRTAALQAGEAAALIDDVRAERRGATQTFQR